MCPRVHLANGRLGKSSALTQHWICQRLGQHFTKELCYSLNTHTHKHTVYIYTHTHTDTHGHTHACSRKHTHMLLGCNFMQLKGFTRPISEDWAVWLVHIIIIVCLSIFNLFHTSTLRHLNIHTKHSTDSLSHSTTSRLNILETIAGISFMFLTSLIVKTLVILWLFILTTTSSVSEFVQASAERCVYC